MTETNARMKIEGVADRYIAVWNEPDTDARKARRAASTEELRPAYRASSM